MAWPENEDVVELFQYSDTQWRTSAAGLVGLDYQAVDLVAGWIGIKIDDETFRKLKLLEGYYLAGLRDAAKRGTDKPQGSPEDASGC